MDLENQIICDSARCGIYAFWTKANNEFKGIPVGQCYKSYYSIMLPLDRNQPYYLEEPVALDDGNIACGEYQDKYRGKGRALRSSSRVKNNK